MRIAAGIEYNGAAFHGWQSQRHDRNVQDCLEKALALVADHAVRVHCAGRTDSGVHALQQIIHFDTRSIRENHAWVLGGNVNLPGEVRILWARRVAADFHARFSATGREYRYFILNRAAAPALQAKQLTWECRPLDTVRMARAAQDLIGEHDFTSYRAVACQARTPVRELRALEVTRHDDLIVLRLRANAFLHHMVRNIAGVLMAIGRGAEKVSWAGRVLDARDRTLGGVTAPPDGLYLTEVEYPERFPLPKRRPVYCLFHGAERE